MNWAERASNIKVGDEVAISARFLRAISCHTGELPQARGTVKALGKFGDVTVALVDWGSYEVEPKVLLANLMKVTERGIVE